MAAPANQTRQQRRTRARHGLIAAAIAVTLTMVGAAAVSLHRRQYVASTTLVIVGAPTISQREFSTRTTIDPSLRSWLARFDNPTVVADIYARVYQSTAQTKLLRDEGVSGRISVVTKSSVTSDSPGHGPVMVLSIFADAPGAAVSQLSVLVDDLVERVAADQAGADPTLVVVPTVVSRGDRAVPVVGSRMRSAVGFASSAALVAAIAFVTMGWVSRRRRVHEGHLTATDALQDELVHS